MPELPEVETVLRSIIKFKIKGYSIDRIKIKKKININVKKEEFINILLGRKLINIERKGKQLLFFFDNDLILINHLRMTGKYSFNNFLIEEKSIRLIFYFNNGKKLIFQDSRGFGTFYLQKSTEYKELIPYKNIGPDLINDKIDLNKILFYCKNKNVFIKNLILDQKIISGIGNIYASEILFSSKISPFLNSKNINLTDLEKIIYIAKLILNKSINLGGTSIFDFISPYGKGSYQNELKVYSRNKKSCYECNDIIIKIKMNKRSTFFCPNCQK